MKILLYCNFDLKTFSNETQKEAKVREQHSENILTNSSSLRHNLHEKVFPLKTNVNTFRLLPLK